MINKMRPWWFVRHPNKDYPEFVRTLRAHLDMNHLSEFDFLEELFRFSFKIFTKLKARDVDRFQIYDINRLSTKDVKVSLVVADKGAYEEHMHANSEACLMIIFGKGQIILNGEKKSLGSRFWKSNVFNVQKGVYHGFEVKDKKMVFLSIQHPPILDHGVEDVHFRPRNAIA